MSRIKSSPVLVQPASTRYQVIVPVKPVAKGRPRFSAHQGRVRAYTPKPTVNHEAFVRMCCLDQVGTPCLTGALQLSMEFIMPIPATLSRADRMAAMAGARMPTKKPDWDNLSKVIDALNGIAWADDAQIVLATVAKRYGTAPCTVITWSAMPPGGHGALLL